MSKELDKILEAAAIESAAIETLRDDLSAAEKRLDALRAQAEKQLQADLAKLTGKKTPPKNTHKPAKADAIDTTYNEAMARS
jgi:hypothetical protein